MLDAPLLHLVRRENPWFDNPSCWETEVARRAPDGYLDRRQADVLELQLRGLPRDRATLIIGPRQAGKSTLAWRMLRELGRPALFVDCELHRMREWCRDPSAFLEDAHQLMPRLGAVFLEEAQHLDEAGLFVKGLIDRRISCPVIVTGSASYHLRAKTRESLAGRAQRARLLPFCLQEVAPEPPEVGPAILRAKRLETWERHLVTGGYPAAWRAEDPRPELAGLIEAHVLRDASDLFRVERPDAFRALLRLAAQQTGSVVNLSEWASIVGVSVPTVNTYLDIMEESHLLARLPPFEGGKRAELTRSPKLYFLDTGLRNALVGDMTPFEYRSDRGPLLECWLYTELVKALPHSTSILWWRTRSGAEVDLVVSDGTRRIGIEVKASALTRPQLKRGAHSFLEAYQPDLFLVANLGLAHRDQVQGIAVEWLHPIDVVDRVIRASAAV